MVIFTDQAFFLTRRTGGMNIFTNFQSSSNNLIILIIDIYEFHATHSVVAYIYETTQKFFILLNSNCVAFQSRFRISHPHSMVVVDFQQKF